LVLRRSRLWGGGGEGKKKKGGGGKEIRSLSFPRKTIITNIASDSKPNALKKRKGGGGEKKKGGRGDAGRDNYFLALAKISYFPTPSQQEREKGGGGKKKKKRGEREGGGNIGESENLLQSRQKGSFLPLGKAERWGKEGGGKGGGERRRLLKRSYKSNRPPQAEKKEGAPISISLPRVSYQTFGRKGRRKGKKPGLFANNSH